MLSTTRTKFPFQILLIAISILLLALAVVMTYRAGVLPAFSAGQSSIQDLTSLSVEEVSSHRWQAKADYYAAQQVQVPVTGNDLLILSAAEEASTQRWQAMADFYTGQTSMTVQYGPPGR